MLEEKTNRMTQREITNPQIELDISTPSIINKTCRQKISKYLEDLKSIISHLDLTDLYRAFHPTTAQYTFFSCAFRTFPIETIFWVTKKVTVYKGCRSCKVYSLAKEKLEINSRDLETPQVFGN